MPSAAPADLDPAEFHTLNSEFYRADPADVIDHRLWMLAAFIVDDAVAAGSPEEMRVSREPVPTIDERLQFVSLESTLILHQAAETFLRLCVAHWSDAPCPWFEMARLRQPRVFPARVREIERTLDTDETLDQLLAVVSWTAEYSAITTVPALPHERWESHREGLRELARECCTLLLQGAEVYNAGKHGLAILPSTKGMSLDDGALISVNGPSLTVIERQTHDGEARWAKVVHWVQYKRAVAMTSLLASAIRSLWECGKNRRVGGGDLSHLRFFSIDEVNQVRTISAPESGVMVSSMSEVLFDLEHPMFEPTN